MSSSPGDRCGYVWPEDFEDGDLPNHQSSCWRQTHSEEADRCLWHESAPDVEKSNFALSELCVDVETREECSKYSELLDGAIFRGDRITDTVSLRRVALRDCKMPNVDLTDVDLVDADFSGAELWEADFSGANLTGVSFCEADLRNADLPNSTLKRANLTNADLIDGNISNSTLEGADLTGADIRGSTVDNVSLNGSTRCKRLYEGYGEKISRNSISRVDSVRRWIRGSDFGSSEWEATARAYHELKIVLGEHGLIGKARAKHLQERRARRLEVKNTNGRFDTSYLGSLISRVFTGYGIRVQTLAIWMFVLFSISTVTYILSGVETSVVRNFSYSVLAFTVAPPNIPEGTLTQIIMMVETFFGTLSIVLLGYILGNRERL